MRAPFVVSFVIAAACAPASPSTPAPAPAWPVPAGWKSERFSFPLEFAPSIARRGSEELRFPHGFLDAAATTFWSYAFVWWLDDDRPVDAATLGPELVVYFDGLAKAVDAERHKLPADRAPATARLVDAGAGEVKGDVEIWDAFATGGRITLHARVHARRCGGRRAVVFELSRQGEGGAIWSDLDALAAAVPCAP